MASVIMRKDRLQPFDIRVPRKVLRPEVDELSVHWRRLHHEQLHDLSSSQNIVRVTKSRRIKWAGHVACMGRGEVRTEYGWEARREETS